MFTFATEAVGNEAARLFEAKNFVGAVQPLRELLDVLKRVNGPSHDTTRAAANCFALALAAGGQAGQLAEAEEGQRAYQAGLGHVTLQPEHPQHHVAEAAHICALLTGGKFAEAEPLLRTRIEVQTDRWGLEDGHVCDAQGELALSLTGLARDGEAAALWRQALDVQKAHASQGNWVSGAMAIACYLAAAEHGP